MTTRCRYCVRMLAMVRLLRAALADPEISKETRAYVLIETLDLAKLINHHARMSVSCSSAARDNVA